MTNYGLSGAILLFCGSANIPQYSAIGTGSGAAVATLGSLITESLSTRQLFSSRDISTAKNMTQVYDYNSVQMSGILLKEFGVGGSQAVSTNDLWMREAFAAITFDGTNELELSITFTTF